jgi:hypothetical protein
MSQHRWNGKKTATGKEKCSNCGLLRVTHKVVTDKKVKTQFGVKLLRITKYQYYRGNRRLDTGFRNPAPPCLKEE